MPKEKTKDELVKFINKMDETEQESLLMQLKKREAYFMTIELDKKQRAYNKGRKTLSMDEVVKIVREVRRKNAKKAA